MNIAEGPNGDVYSTDSEDYELIKPIGFGYSAVVYMAKYTKKGEDNEEEIVSIKMIDLDRYEKNVIEEMRKEIQVMKISRHENLLMVLTSFLNGSKLWIVEPLIIYGSCSDIIKNYYPEGLSEVIISVILFQALRATDYLHKNGYIHRDIKAGNLLMDKDGIVKLADFGVSSSLMDDGVRTENKRRTFVGTPCWMAPEVMEMSSGYNAKADIWSFGITALELAYGSAPFSKYPPMKVIYLILSSGPPTLDRSRTKNKYSKAFKDMISLCLQKDPEKRPTAESLLRHTFFSSLFKESLVYQNVSNPCSIKSLKKVFSYMDNFLTTIKPVYERADKETFFDTESQLNSEDDSVDVKELNNWDFDGLNDMDLDRYEKSGDELSIINNKPHSRSSECFVNSVRDRYKNYILKNHSDNEYMSVDSLETHSFNLGTRRGRFNVFEGDNNIIDYLHNVKNNKTMGSLADDLFMENRKGARGLRKKVNTSLSLLKEDKKGRFKILANQNYSDMNQHSISTVLSEPPLIHGGGNLTLTNSNIFGGKDIFNTGSGKTFRKERGRKKLLDGNYNDGINNNVYLNELEEILSLDGIQRKELRHFFIDKRIFVDINSGLFDALESITESFASLLDENKSLKGLLHRIHKDA